MIALLLFSLRQDSEAPIHHQLPPEHSDELTTHCQLILIMLQFGANSEVLGCEEAEPISEWAGQGVYTEDQPLPDSILLLRVQYSLGNVTLNPPPPAYTKPHPLNPPSPLLNKMLINFYN